MENIVNIKGIQIDMDNMNEKEGLFVSVDVALDYATNCNISIMKLEKRKSKKINLLKDVKNNIERHDLMEDINKLQNKIDIKKDELKMQLDFINSHL